jgi:restriction system protein
MCKVLAPYVAGAVLLSGLFGAAKLATTRVAASTSTAASTTLQQIKSQGPGDFEKMCAEILRAQGWQVDVAPPGADGGIDLRMRNADEQAYGQCKNWNTWKVPVTSIREFYGVMCRDGVKRGYFITSGKFTAEARREARGMGIELFDGAALQKHLNR